jgi:hypothetical protein
MKREAIEITRVGPVFIARVPQYDYWVYASRSEFDAKHEAKLFIQNQRAEALEIKEKRQFVKATGLSPAPDDSNETMDEFFE